MKSTIRIKTDYTSQNRKPVIEIQAIKSEDPRDEMVNDFLNIATCDTYMCFVELVDGPDGLRYQLRPVSVYDANEDFYKFRQFYNAQKKAKEDEKHQVHEGAELPYSMQQSENK